MTLRCDISIVPYGDEDNQYRITRFDISNEGYVDRSECRYSVTVSRPNLTSEDVLTRFEIPRHNRIDGAEELVRKTLEKYLQIIEEKSS